MYIDSAPMAALSDRDSYYHTSVSVPDSVSCAYKMSRPRRSYDDVYISDYTFNRMVRNDQRMQECLKTLEPNDAVSIVRTLRNDIRALGRGRKIWALVDKSTGDIVDVAKTRMSARSAKTPNTTVKRAVVTLD